MAKKHSRSTVIAADKSTAGSQYTGTQTHTDTDTQTQRNTDTRTAITNRNVKPDDSDHLLRSTPLHRVPSWPAPSESLPRKFRQTFRNCPTVVSAFTSRIYLRVTLRCLLLPHFRRFRCHSRMSIAIHQRQSSVLDKLEMLSARLGFTPGPQPYGSLRVFQTVC